MGHYVEPAELSVDENFMHTTDPERFVGEAEDEMNAKLGVLFVVPIVTENLPLHEALLLKTIARKIASGKLIAAMSVTNEDASVHAYARSLLNEGTQDLHLIANGDVPFSAPRADHQSPGDERDATGIGAVGARVPSIRQEDSESLLDPFHKTVFGGRPWQSPGPGDLV